MNTSNSISHNQTQEKPAQLWRVWLHQRGITDRTIRAFDIQPARGGWQYAVNPAGTLRWKAFPENPAPGKYRWPHGRPEATRFYDPNGTLKHEITAANGTLILCEGEPDVWALHSAGIHNATCTLYGAPTVPTWTRSELAALNVTTLRMWPDRDHAGRRYAAELAAALDGEPVTLAYELPDVLGDGGDLNALWLACGLDAARFAAALDGCPRLTLPTTPQPQPEPRLTTLTASPARADAAQVTIYPNGNVWLSGAAWQDYQNRVTAEIARHLVKRGNKPNYYECPCGDHPAGKDFLFDATTGKIGGCQGKHAGMFTRFEDLAGYLEIDTHAIRFDIAREHIARNASSVTTASKTSTSKNNAAPAKTAGLAAATPSGGQQDIPSGDAGMLAESGDILDSGTAENEGELFFRGLCGFIYRSNTPHKTQKNTGRGRPTAFYTLGNLDGWIETCPASLSFRALKHADISSVRNYRAHTYAAHAIGVPGIYTRSQLAAALDVSPSATRAYDKAAGITVIERFHRERIDGTNLPEPGQYPPYAAWLESTRGDANDSGRRAGFPVTPMGYDYALRESIAFDGRAIVWLVRRQANYYDVPEFDTDPVGLPVEVRAEAIKRGLTQVARLIDALLLAGVTPGTTLSTPDILRIAKQYGIGDRAARGALDVIAEIGAEAVQEAPETAPASETGESLVQYGLDVLGGVIVPDGAPANAPSWLFEPVTYNGSSDTQNNSNTRHKEGSNVR